MTGYLVKRCILVIPVLLVTAFLVFGAIHLSPGDPVDIIVGPIAPPRVREEMRQKLGLDKPLPVQFGLYMSRILQGDLGQSILNKRDVSEMIGQKLPITIELGVTAFLITYLLGIPLGTIAAHNRNKAADWATMVIALLGVSMPAFWLGLLLMYVFSVNLRVFPATGSGGVQYLILPALALGLPFVGRVARITRSTILEVIGQDYIRTAHAKGLRQSVVIYRHTMRNAMIPVISLMGLDLGYILGGAVVIEHVFARPGIGDMMLRSIYSRDFPVLQGCMFVLTAGIILGNILADVGYVLIDPRIRR
jgi:peptide/nickel transport system permease protein